MPGGLPGIGFEQTNAATVGVTPATSLGVAVTPGTNTPGSWVQLTTGTLYDCCWMAVTVSNGLANGKTFAVAIDIGIGASGSQVVIVNKLLTIFVSAGFFSFPISIPANTALWVRAQGDNTGGTSYTASVQLILFDGALHQIEGCSGVDAIGFNGTKTYGTLITCSSTSNVKGSYAQLTTGTLRDYVGFMIAVDTHQQNYGTGTTYNNSHGQQVYAGTIQSILLDIAIGTSGNQVVILPNQMIQGLMDNGSGGGTNAPVPLFPPIGVFFIPIPANTAIWARAQCAGTPNTVGVTFGVTLYGIYQ